MADKEDIFGQKTTARLIDEGGKLIKLQDKEFVLLLPNEYLLELEKITGISVLNFSPALANPTLNLTVDVLYCGLMHYKNEHGYPIFTRKAVVKMLPKIASASMMQLFADITEFINKIFEMDEDDPFDMSLLNGESEEKKSKKTKVKSGPSKDIKNITSKKSE